MRIVFRLPVVLYRLGLGRLMGKRFLILTTTGRISGKPRQTALEYSRNPSTGTFFLMSGWGGKSDWYRNARANPRVCIQVGGEKIAGRAVPASDEEVVQVMEAVMRVYPKATRTWSAFSGVAYDGTRASLLRIARAFPSVIIIPEQPQAR